MTVHCVVCNEEINLEKESHAIGESLGEYWCYNCGMDEVERASKEGKDHKLGFDNLA